MAIRNPMSKGAWSRHTNPWSGATRMLGGAALLFALYRHSWKALGATVAFLILNPILFSEPEDTDNWLSEGVLGEEAWIADDNSMFGTGYPELLNVLNVPLYLYTLYAAYRQYPVRTFVGFVVTFVLKIAFVDAMGRYYRVRRDLR
ncbi:DUF6653 family protein [Halalkalicoccus subterraneus]|uniref:DUF6653 family protein n=1 Tax=Halalkalicoccus subterraneus TaxID=2675002 RepID=UPI001FE4AC3D|nr:DUF6653 family protein [Halalkalicoccus subterraneus]